MLRPVERSITVSALERIAHHLVVFSSMQPDVRGDTAIVDEVDLVGIGPKVASRRWP
ncbi:hypothetical protein ACNJYD_09105 [Bradyrhizobium sp. DASA03005]|uniref:hypothetical protein n=1 Tax=Bradyrhizobium sp. SPXBL-02 TaxID=3395912 RepID=UPI003F6EA5A6